VVVGTGTVIATFVTGFVTRFVTRTVAPTSAGTRALSRITTDAVTMTGAKTKVRMTDHQRRCRLGVRGCGTESALAGRLCA